jgi:hypothetical protein
MTHCSACNAPECDAVEGSIPEQLPQRGVMDLYGGRIQHTGVTEPNLHTAQNSTAQHSTAQHDTRCWSKWSFPCLEFAAWQLACANTKERRGQLLCWGPAPDVHRVIGQQNTLGKQNTTLTYPKYTRPLLRLQDYVVAKSCVDKHNPKARSQSQHSTVTAQRTCWHSRTKSLTARAPPRHSPSSTSCVRTSDARRLSQ